MKSFFISKVKNMEIPEDRILELKNTKLSDDLWITHVETNNNTFNFELFEKIKALNKFLFMDENNQILSKEVEYDSGIKVIIVFLVRKSPINILISCLEGPGNLIIQKRGRKYIDTYIGPLLVEKLTGDSRNYQPFVFTLKHMNWKIWGEKLKALNINIEGRGKMNLLNFPEWEFLNSKDNLFSDYNVLSFSVLQTFELKVKNKEEKKSVHRTIKIQKNGIVKCSLSPDILLNYLNTIL